MPGPAKSRYDVAVIGAGVLGLWTARYLSEAGLSVALVEKGRAGSGASGGLLGALLPHMPTGWNGKKQFQLEALVALPEETEKLKALTGIDTGYRRCGRISPVRKPGFLRQTQTFVEQHKAVWPTAEYRLGQAAGFVRWLDRRTAPLGVAHETLSARIDPQAYCAALAAAVADKVDTFEGTIFERYDTVENRVHLSGKDPLFADRLVLTAGAESFALLAPLLGSEIGTGISGHVALFTVDVGADEAPIIYDDGVYIVPQQDGYVAVGSGKDADDMERVIARAETLCPCLHGAKRVQTWSGVRPRCHAKDPLIGQVPDHPVFVATGGFKITLGIAHHMARALADRVTGAAQPLALPESYTMAYHLDQLANRKLASQSEDS